MFKVVNDGFITNVYAYYETYETNNLIKAFIKFLKLSHKYKIMDIEFRG